MTSQENFEAVRQLIGSISGQPACRLRAGRGRSLSVGVGNKVVAPKSPDGFWGEWELGTYRAAWRILRDNRIICASRDAVDSEEEINDNLSKIILGDFVDIQNINDFDIRVSFTAATVEFFCAFSDKDQIFHVFCKDNVFLEWRVPPGWTIGRSDVPWVV